MSDDFDDEVYLTDEQARAYYSAMLDLKQFMWHHWWFHNAAALFRDGWRGKGSTT